MLRVTAAQAARGLAALLIPSGAHHIDLFFSRPDDPGDVRAARAAERDHIARWIAAAGAGKERWVRGAHTVA